jgi:hypothetical protein
VDGGGWWWLLGAGLGYNDSNSYINLIRDLSCKANVSDTYVKTQVDTHLANKSDTYIKTEVDTYLTNKSDNACT